MRTLAAVLCLALTPSGAVRAGELAYSRLTDGFWQLWLYREGVGHERITDGPSDKRRPRWIGATTLLFRTNNGELYQVEIGREPVAFRKDAWPSLDPTWSPSAVKVAFARLRTDRRDASEIVLASPDDGSLRNLTLHPGFYTEPAFSLDGAWLAFVSSNGYQGADIVRVPARGGSTEVLVADGAHNASPVLAPDGASVAYASNVSGSFEIWTLRISGGERTQLTDQPGFDGLPAYRTDSNRITFVTQRRGRLEIWEMAADGASPAPLFEIDADSTDPAWRPAP